MRFSSLKNFLNIVLFGHCDKTDFMMCPTVGKCHFLASSADCFQWILFIWFTVLYIYPNQFRFIPEPIDEFLLSTLFTNYFLQSVSWLDHFLIANATQAAWANSDTGLGCGTYLKTAEWSLVSDFISRIRNKDDHHEVVHATQESWAKTYQLRRQLCARKSYGKKSAVKAMKWFLSEVI